MKKIVLIISILTSLSLFSQDLSFVKNRSLLNKINNITTFIKESPTIRDNYTNDEIYIYTDGNVAMTIVLYTNIGMINVKNRCVKINKNTTWIIDDINDINDKFIDKNQLKKVSDCSCIVKKKKSPEMLNSVFNYVLDVDGDYLLDSLVTFDRLLYLDIEYREDLDDKDDNK